MKKVYFVIALFISGVSLAQQVDSVAARVVDENTGAPVSFVNVGFIDKGIGTITNEEGVFVLPYKTEAITLKDDLQISSIGYEAKQFSFEELKNLNSYKVTISLKPKTYGLDQVVLKSTSRNRKVLGNPDIPSYNM